MYSLLQAASPSAVFSAYASISALIMLFKNMFHQFIPQQLQNYVVSAVGGYFKCRTSMTTLVVEQRDGLVFNEIYDAAETYLCAMTSHDIQRLKIYKQPKEKNLIVSFDGCETVVDSFQGIDLKWKFITEEKKDSNRGSDSDSGNSSGSFEERYLELIFDKKYKERVLNSYISFVINRAKAIKDEQRTVKLHTLAHIKYSGFASWDYINLQHPSTFQTLAMDPEQKNDIIEDLDRFVERKEFYRKVGKAWKRGYLLYGPPGTGKSSLIAAIANHLKFDIYDLQLANVRKDSHLRKLLLSTANRSILVIEDIDCSVELPGRNGSQHKDELHEKCCSRPEERKHPRDQQFSLSGLLNFIDGLWSSCGDERIIIFTTNNRDKLDPALLRPGRMDKHIFMSYLTMDGFKTLAANYLDIKDQHSRFNEIEELIQSMKVTPAEVAEELMKSDDADVCLGQIVDFLKERKIKSTETKDEELEGIEVMDEDNES